MTRRSLLSLLPLAGLRAAAPRVRPFALRDVHGRRHTLAGYRGARAIALIFVATECPITNSYVPELNRLHAAFAPRGVRFFAVHSDRTESVDRVRSYSGEYGYTFPVLLDHRLTLARQTGATVMPEAVVLTPAGELLYRGRINDRYAGWGRKRPEPTEHDLQRALDAALVGDRTFHLGPKAIGCYIPFLDEKS